MLLDCLIVIAWLIKFFVECQYLKKDRNLLNVSTCAQSIRVNYISNAILNNLITGTCRVSYHYEIRIKLI